MSNRKLQGEIDRVLKKVEDGVHVFEQTWDKVYSAATTAQKEKYEGDLKKEIKKLQRLRDQIKTWQGDSAIKDKSKLDYNRKLIEEKMEKFKVCEKETKTKAFSKEGLAQDRTDPKQKAKDNVNDWVREAITRLTEQNEEMEAEIERLNSGKRKKRNDENPRVKQLKDHITRHHYHMEMLERVLRAVYNDAVTPEEAEELKDSVDYYIESNQDPDFYEDDEMYEQLNLEAIPTTATLAVKKSSKEDGEEEEDVSSSPTPTPVPPKKGPPSPRSARNGKSNSQPTSNTKSAGNSQPSRNPSPKDRRGGGVSNIIANNNNNSNVDHGASQTVPRSPRKGVVGALASRDASSTSHTNAPLLSNVVRASANKTNPRPVGVNHTTSTNVQNSRRGLPTKETVTTATGIEVDTTQSETNHLTVNGTLPLRENGPMFPPLAAPETSISTSKTPGSAPVPGSVSKPTVSVVPSKPVSSAESATVTVATLATENNANEVLLDEVLEFMPDAPTVVGNIGNPQKRGPSTFTKHHANSSSPRNPVEVPSSFPSVSAPVFDSREVFQQFDPDTLFFIFYYQQGTYQQFLAASELKRQGWRFHKKYLTWFQRHDEPRVSTEDYETGTFIYFDYANVVVRGEGSGWCQRIKSEFRFEYRFLEDELV